MAEDVAIADSGRDRRRTPDAREIAQVDFGSIGKLWDPDTGRMREAYVLVLGYSRHMVVHIVLDQKIETWLRLYVEAFEELGAVPRRARRPRLASPMKLMLMDPWALDAAHTRVEGMVMPKRKATFPTGIRHQTLMVAARGRDRHRDRARAGLRPWADVGPRRGRGRLGERGHDPGREARGPPRGH